MARAEFLDAPAARDATRRLVRRLGRYRLRVGGALGLAVVVGLLSAVNLGGLVPFLSVVLEGNDLAQSLEFLTALGGPGETLLRWAEQLGTTDPVQALVLVLGALLVLAIVRGALAFTHEYAVVSVCQRTQLDLAEDLFDRVTEQDESTLARLGLSHLTARFSYDLDMTGKALETMCGTLVLEPLRFVWYLALACALSWKLTLLAVLVVPAVLLLARILGRRIRRSAEGMLEKRALLLSRVQETVTALPVVQVYGQEERERGRFRRVTGRVYSWGKRMARLEATSSPVLEVVNILGILPVLLYGSYLVLEEEMGSATFLTTCFTLVALYAPLRKAVGASNRMQGGVAGAARIFSAMARPSEVRERPDARDFPPIADRIEWRDVTVMYPDGRIALDGVNLHAPAGRTTVIVGPSGSGKTTLLHTLPRLLDPSMGGVHVDGADIRDAKLESLRSRMAIVTQDTRLFGGTLAENVAYARPDADREQIERAGRVARVDEIVRRLPDGWETVLDESGAGLSGGERQRIAVARAVLRDPQVLLLDEATSALDPANESLVDAGLKELAEGRTAIVVAHRRHTVERAHHVIVLRDGRVECEGDPAEVAARSATFRELFGAAPAAVD